MREILKIIHMGNGVESEADCWRLQQRLNDAIILSSAYQQGGRVKTKLVACLQDIVVGIMGEEYTIIPNTCVYCGKTLLTPISCNPSCKEES